MTRPRPIIGYKWPFPTGLPYTRPSCACRTGRTENP